MLVLLAACGHDGRRSADGSARVDPEPSPGCRAGQLPALKGERATIPEGDGTRAYLVDAPPVAADRPLPIVLAFHGFRADAANLRAGDGLVDLAAREQVIVVHVDGHDGVQLLGTTGRGWDFLPAETRDRDIVVAVLDRLEAERCVDRRRVYATGMSNGGLFANLLGCQLAGRLAAVAPVAGAYPLADCMPARPMPVLFIHGRNDRVILPALVREAQQWWVRANGCGGPIEADGCQGREGCRADVVFCEGEHAHVWPPDATGRLWRFFAAHPRPVG